MAPLPDEDPSLQHKDVKNHPFYTEKAPFDELAMEKSYARAARMIKETREVRVFVSSTFRDYNEEREGIVKRVCPGLRDLCQQRGCMYTEIDLRTGVTVEQTVDRMTVIVCLSEIDKCTHFFGMLAARYGWAQGPLSDEVIAENKDLFQDKKDEFLVKIHSDQALYETHIKAWKYRYEGTNMPDGMEFPLEWIRDFGDRSVTELEIRYAVLHRAEPLCCFFALRDDKYAEGKEGWSEDKPQIIEKLKALREQLQNDTFKYADKSMVPVLPPSEYAVPDDCVRFFQTSLTHALQRDLPATAASRFEVLKDAFESHGILAQKTYLGTSHVDAAMSRACALASEICSEGNGSNATIVLSGKSGCGLSSLIGYWSGTTGARDNHSPGIITYYTSAVAEAVNKSAFVHLLIETLKDRTGITSDEPKMGKTLSGELLLWIQMAVEALRESKEHPVTNEKPLLVVLDGMDQLETIEDQELLWLPDPPAGVRFVITAHEGSTTHASLMKRSFATLADGQSVVSESIKEGDEDTGYVIERSNQLVLVKVPEFDKGLRSEIAQKYLHRFNKTLSSDQLKMVVDGGLCGNGVCLSVVLNEIRIFGTFEVFDQFIGLLVSRPNISTLLSSVLDRLSIDFSMQEGGVGLVQTILCALWPSRRGLAQDETEELTKGGLILREDAVEKPKDFRLQTFVACMKAMGDVLARRNGVLNFSSRFVTETVKSKYIIALKDESATADAMLDPTSPTSAQDDLRLSRKNAVDALSAEAKQIEQAWETKKKELNEAAKTEEGQKAAEEELKKMDDAWNDGWGGPASVAKNIEKTQKKISELGAGNELEAVRLQGILASQKATQEDDTHLAIVQMQASKFVDEKNVEEKNRLKKIAREYQDADYNLRDAEKRKEVQIARVKEHHLLETEVGFFTSTESAARQAMELPFLLERLIDSATDEGDQKHHCEQLMQCLVQLPVFDALYAAGEKYSLVRLWNKAKDITGAKVGELYVNEAKAKIVAKDSKPEECVLLGNLARYLTFEAGDYPAAWDLLEHALLIDEACDEVSGGGVGPGSILIAEHLELKSQLLKRFMYVPKDWNTGDRGTTGERVTKEAVVILDRAISIIDASPAQDAAHKGMHADVLRAQAYVHLMPRKSNVKFGESEHDTKMMEQLSKALQLAHEIKDLARVGVTLNGIGTLYEKGMMLAEASKNYQDSLAVRRRCLSPTDPDMAQVLVSLGLCQRNIGLATEDAAKRTELFQSSLEYYAEAGQVYHATLGPVHPRCGHAYHGLAATGKEMGLIDDALVNVDKAILMRESLRGTGFMAQFLEQSEKLKEELLAMKNPVVAEAESAPAEAAVYSPEEAQSSAPVDTSAADKAEADKAEADKAAADKAAADKAEADKAEADKAEADKAEADKAEADKAEADKKAAVDKAEADKAEADKAAADKAAADKAAADKAAADKAAADKAAADKAAADKAAADKAATDKPAAAAGTPAATDQKAKSCVIL